MSLKAAVDRLGVLSVTGVKNFGLDDMPGFIHQADLPALVIILGASGGAGVQSLNIGHSKVETTVGLTHRLLVDMPVADVPQNLVYQSLAHVDNYFAAIKGDLLLNDNLIHPLSVMSVSFGEKTFGNMVYYGIDFYHVWNLAV